MMTTMMMMMMMMIMMMAHIKAAQYCRPLSWHYRNVGENAQTEMRMRPPPPLYIQYILHHQFIVTNHEGKTHTFHSPQVHT